MTHESAETSVVNINTRISNAYLAQQASAIHDGSGAIGVLGKTLVGAWLGLMAGAAVTGGPGAIPGAVIGGIFGAGYGGLTS